MKRVIGLGFLLILGACAEQAGSGRQVSVPSVTINCTASNCRTGGTARVYLTLTTSGCGDSNINFGAAATASSVITCTVGTGCTGSVSNWSSSSGSSTVGEGTYSICGTIDFNSSWVGTPEAGDARSTLDNVGIVTGTAAQTLSSWSNVN